MMLGAFVTGLIYLTQERQLRTKRVTRLFWILPSLLRSEQDTFRWLTIGFSLLTATVLTGGLLILQHSLIDIETIVHAGMAIFAWAIYAFILISRRKIEWDAPKVILLSVLGFIIIFTLFLEAHILA